MSPRYSAWSGLRRSDASSLSLKTWKSRSCALACVAAVAGTCAAAGTIPPAATSEQVRTSERSFILGGFRCGNYRPLMQKGRRDNVATPLRSAPVDALPEEVRDHVHD